jgi:hypothetical protein
VPNCTPARASRWQGRTQLHPLGLQKHAAKRVCDIIQPDLSHAGGISEVRRIAAMRKRTTLPSLPNAAWPVALASCLQVDFVHQACFQEQSLGMAYNQGNEMSAILQTPKSSATKNGFVGLLQNPGPAWKSTKPPCARWRKPATTGKTRSPSGGRFRNGMVTPLKLNTPDCLLGENPVWYAPTGEYLWTDILRGTIYAYAPKTGGVRTVLETPYQTGAFLVSDDGSLVIFTERGVFTAMRCENGFRLLDKPLFTVPFAEGERFNDAIADPRGRMLSGSKRADNTEGRLWRFSAGKDTEVLLEHLCISNAWLFARRAHILPHGFRALRHHRVRLRARPTAYNRALSSSWNRTSIRTGRPWTHTAISGSPFGARDAWNAYPRGKTSVFHPAQNKAVLQSVLWRRTPERPVRYQRSVGGKEGETPLGGGCYLLKNTGTGKPDYPAKTHLVGV